MDGGTWQAIVHWVDVLGLLYSPLGRCIFSPCTKNRYSLLGSDRVMGVRRGSGCEGRHLQRTVASLPAANAGDGIAMGQL